MTLNKRIKRNEILYVNDYDVLSGDNYLKHIESLLTAGVEVGGNGLQQQRHFKHNWPLQRGFDKYNSTQRCANES